MKRERLEELVDAAARGSGAIYDVAPIRAALLAVERETVERCAWLCDRWSGVGDTQVAQPLAAAIRSLLTEET